MTSMSYLTTSLLLQLNSVDVIVEDMEKALIPIEDEDEAAALIHILYSNHYGHM
jgi:hypothetical protein